MLLDRLRKKAKKSAGGDDSSLETVDITGQVPEVDDVLAEIDKVLQETENLLLQKRCGC